MGSYVDRVLQPGETVTFTSRIHWVAYVPALLLIALGIAAGVVAGMATDFRPAANAVAALALLFGVLNFISAWFTRWTTEIAVTSKRVIFKRGFIRRHTIEMNMDKVESVDVNQTILGRILGYGDVTIHGTGAGLEPLHTIDSPLEFRNAVIAR
jgi:uncharacterized membrane protein YdbT with pleckstrin-like domain